MKSIDILLKNKIPLEHAFNILLVSNNIRKVAQLEYIWYGKNKRNKYSKTTIDFLKKYLTKHNINFIENRGSLLIYNDNITIDKKKLSSNKYGSHYVGKILDIACATKDFMKLYKRKKNAPFQVRFVVSKIPKTKKMVTDDMYEKDVFMAQMCVDNKTLIKSHKQITKFQKELSKRKLDDEFIIHLESDPQPI